MNCRAFLGALSGSLLAAPLAAEAQPALGDTAPHGQLFLLAFLFVVVVLFLLCAGLLMLVFRRVRPLESGSPETGPRMRLPGELPHEAIAHDESTPSPGAEARGAPRGADPPREASRDAGEG
jgi:hypothetical protein